MDQLLLEYSYAETKRFLWVFKVAYLFSIRLFRYFFFTFLPKWFISSRIVCSSAPFAYSWWFPLRSYSSCWEIIRSIDVKLVGRELLSELTPTLINEICRILWIAAPSLSHWRPSKAYPFKVKNRQKRKDLNPWTLAQRVQMLSNLIFFLYLHLSNGHMLIVTYHGQTCMFIIDFSGAVKLIILIPSIRWGPPMILAAWTEHLISFWTLHLLRFL